LTDKKHTSARPALFRWSEPERIFAALGDDQQRSTFIPVIGLHIMQYQDSFRADFGRCFALLVS
jgi:hypothetical protein